MYNKTIWLIINNNNIGPTETHCSPHAQPIILIGNRWWQKNIVFVGYWLNSRYNASQKFDN
jgi:hypothetical protein